MSSGIKSFYRSIKDLRIALLLSDPDRALATECHGRVCSGIDLQPTGPE